MSSVMCSTAICVWKKEKNATRMSANTSAPESFKKRRYNKKSIRTIVRIDHFLRDHCCRTARRIRPMPPKSSARMPNMARAEVDTM